MAWITITRLQREYGLSVLAASTLVDEQRRLAARRHRILQGAATACALAAAASAIFDLHWPKIVSGALWLLGLALIFPFVYLVHRDSREPILAAARTWHADDTDKPAARA